MKLLTAIFIGTLFILANLAAASETMIGSVKTAKGASDILRDGKVIPAKIGEKLFEKDTLKTGANGSMGVIFKDNTSLSLGPESQIVLDEFVYSPAEGKLSIVTEMARGTAAYVSGNIGKLSPESVRFETPLATLGIRGTKFVVKVEDR